MSEANIPHMAEVLEAVQSIEQSWLITYFIPIDGEPQDQILNFRQTGGVPANSYTTSGVWMIYDSTVAGKTGLKASYYEDGDGPLAYLWKYYKWDRDVVCDALPSLFVKVVRPNSLTKLVGAEYKQRFVAYKRSGGATNPPLEAQKLIGLALASDPIATHLGSRELLDTFMARYLAYYKDVVKPHIVSNIIKDVAGTTRISLDLPVLGTATAEVAMRASRSDGKGRGRGGFAGGGGYRSKSGKRNPANKNTAASSIPTASPSNVSLHVDLAMPHIAVPDRDASAHSVPGSVETAGSNGKPAKNPAKFIITYDNGKRAKYQFPKDILAMPLGPARDKAEAEHKLKKLANARDSSVEHIQKPSTSVGVQGGQPEVDKSYARAASHGPEGRASTPVPNKAKLHKVTVTDRRAGLTAPNVNILDVGRYRVTFPNNTFAMLTSIMLNNNDMSGLPQAVIAALGTDVSALVLQTLLNNYHMNWYRRNIVPDLSPSVAFPGTQPLFMTFTAADKKTVKIPEFKTLQVLRDLYPSQDALIHKGGVSVYQALIRVPGSTLESVHDVYRFYIDVPDCDIELGIAGKSALGVSDGVGAAISIMSGLASDNANGVCLCNHPHICTRSLSNNVKRSPVAAIALADVVERTSATGTGVKSVAKGAGAGLIDHCAPMYSCHYEEYGDKQLTMHYPRYSAKGWYGNELQVPTLPSTNPFTAFYEVVPTTSPYTSIKDAARYTLYEESLPHKGMVYTPQVWSNPKFLASSVAPINEIEIIFNDPNGAKLLHLQAPLTASLGAVLHERTAQLNLPQEIVVHRGFTCLSLADLSKPLSELAVSKSGLLTSLSVIITTAQTCESPWALFGPHKIDLWAAFEIPKERVDATKTVLNQHSVHTDAQVATTKNILPSVNTNTNVCGTNQEFLKDILDATAKNRLRNLAHEMATDVPKANAVDISHSQLLRTHESRGNSNVSILNIKDTVTVKPASHSTPSAVSTPKMLVACPHGRIGTCALCVDALLVKSSQSGITYEEPSYTPHSPNWSDQVDMENSYAEILEDTQPVDVTLNNGVLLPKLDSLLDSTNVNKSNAPSLPPLRVSTPNTLVNTTGVVLGEDL